MSFSINLLRSKLVGEKSKSKKNKCPVAYYRTWKLFCRFTCKQVYYSFGHLAVFHILFFGSGYLPEFSLHSFLLYLRSIFCVGKVSSHTDTLRSLDVCPSPRLSENSSELVSFAQFFNDFLPFIKVVLLFICLFFVQFDSRILVFRRSPRGFSCRKS